jgi:quinol monooxygenase YgiN
MSVKLIAILHCHADAEEAFEQELKRLVEASVTDEGCLRYELYQYKDEPCTYIIMDEWRDEEMVKAHQEATHYKHFMRVSTVLLAQPPIVKTLDQLL